MQKTFDLFCDGKTIGQSQADVCRKNARETVEHCDELQGLEENNVSGE